MITKKQRISIFSTCFSIFTCQLVFPRFIIAEVTQSENLSVTVSETPSPSIKRYSLQFELCVASFTVASPKRNGISDGYFLRYSLESQGNSLGCNHLTQENAEHIVGKLLDRIFIDVKPAEVSSMAVSYIPSLLPNKPEILAEIANRDAVDKKSQTKKGPESKKGVVESDNPRLIRLINQKPISVEFYDFFRKKGLALTLSGCEKVFSTRPTDMPANVQALLSQEALAFKKKRLFTSAGMVYFKVTPVNLQQ
ncbi:MAG: hypothetical protein NT027_04065 [Proteobacteria bacterium]|nr:hypothetical protein [Pseudomonadota bacterium]